MSILSGCACCATLRALWWVFVHHCPVVSTFPFIVELCFTFYLKLSVCFDLLIRCSSYDFPLFTFTSLIALCSRICWCGRFSAFSYHNQMLSLVGNSIPLITNTFVCASRQTHFSFPCNHLYTPMYLYVHTYCIYFYYILERDQNLIMRILKERCTNF